MGLARFVHRDVAARNVLVHEVGPDEWICKMTDFGLSRSKLTCTQI